MIKYLLIGIFLLCPSINLFGQYQANKVKAALIFNLGDYVKGKHIRQTDTFTIGAYTRSSSIISHLKDLSGTMEINKQQVRVRKMDNPAHLKGLHMLYVGQAYKDQIKDIYNRVKGKNILLITDQVKKKDFFMVNLYKDEKQGTISFEINKRNLDAENFNYSNKLLVYGTTASDLKDLYMETYNKLEKEQNKLEKEQKKLEKAKQNNRSLRQKNKRLQKYMDSLREVKASKEKRLRSLSQQINNREKIFTEQRNKITTLQARENNLKAKIDSQQANFLRAQDTLQALDNKIKAKEDKISQQDHLLSQKEKLLGTQKKLIWVSAGLAIALLIAIFSIIRAYRVKKRMNKYLEKEVAKRTRELKNSEMLFRSLAESSPDYIIRYAQDLSILYANQNVRSLIGSSDQDETFNTAEQAALAKRLIDPEKIREVLDTGKNLHKETTILLNNQNRTFDWNVVPEKNQEGELISALAVSREITQLKTIQEQLRHAKNQAEESDRLKSAFLENLSHEIRTPLNAILGLSEIIQTNDITDQERNQYTSIIRSKGYHLLDLINDIIDISQIEAGRTNIDYQPFDLHQLLNELYQSFKVILKQKEKDQAIELVFDKTITTEAFMINSDKHRLQQILHNLLSNAVKFTEKGFIQVGYTFQHSGSLIFYVKDSGVGIPQKHQQTIFDRFNKAHENEKQVYEGTGLGLSIVQRLIHLMDGEIWVDSQPGAGTVFYFTLPHWQAQDQNLSKSQGHTTYPPHEHIDLTNKTVLIVDDEPGNLKYLAEALKHMNASIIKAQGGEECLQELNSNPKTDLILLDIKMSPMDGYKVLNKIKSINSHIPVIAQTAYAMPKDRNNFLEAGFDGYLSKPIDQDQLIQELSHIAQKQ